MSKAEVVTAAKIETAEPALDEARSLLSGFQTMIRERRLPARDRKAVAAALAEPWLNGQNEGQITRLKLAKRQMFARAKLELLEARLIGAGLARLHRECA